MVGEVIEEVVEKKIRVGVKKVVAGEVVVGEVVVGEVVVGEVVAGEVVGGEIRVVVRCVRLVYVEQV